MILELVASGVSCRGTVDCILIPEYSRIIHCSFFSAFVAIKFVD